MSGSREQIRAIFLAVIMITSVVAFSGIGAASSATNNGVPGNNINAGTTDVPALNFTLSSDDRVIFTGGPSQSVSPGDSLDAFENADNVVFSDSDTTDSRFDPANDILYIDGDGTRTGSFTANDQITTDSTSNTIGDTVDPTIKISIAGGASGQVLQLNSSGSIASADTLDTIGLQDTAPASSGTIVTINGQNAVLSSKTDNGKSSKATVITTSAISGDTLAGGTSIVEQTTSSPSQIGSVTVNGAQNDGNTDGVISLTIDDSTGPGNPVDASAISEGDPLVIGSSTVAVAAEDGGGSTNTLKVLVASGASVNDNEAVQSPSINTGSSTDVDTEFLDDVDSIASSFNKEFSATGVSANAENDGSAALRIESGTGAPTTSSDSTGTDVRSNLGLDSVTSDAADTFLTGNGGSAPADDSSPSNTNEITSATVNGVGLKYFESGTSDYQSSEDIVEIVDPDADTNNEGVSGDVQGIYGDALVDLTVTNAGSLSTSEINNVKVFADDGNTDGKFDSGDTEVGFSNTINQNTNSFEITSIDNAFGNSSTSDSETYFVTVDIADGAPTDETVRLRIAPLSDGSTSGTFDSGDQGLFVEGSDDGIPGSAITNANAQTITGTAATLAGGDDGNIAYEIDGGAAQDVLTGSNDQELGAISFLDQNSGEFRGTVDLSFGPAVTINESASDLTGGNTVLPGTDASFTVDSVSVANNSHTLEIDISGSSSAGDQLDIKSGALHVEVDGGKVDTTGSATELPATFNAFNNDLTIRESGGEVNDGFLNTQNIQTTIGSDAPSVDSTGQELDAEPQLNDIDADEIGNGSEIVLSIQGGTGVTFDQSVDPTSTSSGSYVVTTTESGGSSDSELTLDGSSKELDVDNATLTATQLTVPVNGSITSGGNSIFFQTDGDSDLAFNVSGDATNADLNVSIAPTSPSRSYQLGGLTSSNSKQETFTEPIKPATPSMDFNDDTDDNVAAVVGLNKQDPSALSGNEQISIDTSGNADLTGGKFLNITTNSSAVTFDTSTEASGTKLRNTVTTQSTINTILDGNEDDDVQNITVTSNEIALGLDSDGVPADSNALNIDLSDSEFNLNVSNGAADDTKVQFNATSGPVQFSDSSNVLNLERPDVVFNGDQGNVSVSVDNDGTTTTVSPGRQGDLADTALHVDSDAVNGKITDASNVTVTLEPDTGVTFDKSAAVNKNSPDDSPNGDIDVFGDDDNNPGDAENLFSAGGTIGDVTVNDNSIEIQLVDKNSDGATTSLASGDSVVIDELPLNISSGASNTTVSVTTNATLKSASPPNVETTTEAANIIEVSSVSPSKLAVDADLSDNTKDFSNGQVAAVNNPQVDNGVAGAVRVQNGGDFGGADVNLEIVETPEGSSGSSLNTTLLTTDQNGEAFYNFTAGDTTGDYVVNVSIDGVSGGLNVTYTAQPGSVAGVNVTPIENAIAGDSAETGVAALFVNSTDANGNRVTGSSPTVEITADNVGISNVEVDNDFGNSVIASNVDSEGINNDGTFSLHSSDGSSVVLVKSSQLEDVTITADVSGNSDTGTVTFFDEVGGIDLSLNETSVAVDDTVTADATITEADGTTIEVPDVTVDFDDNNDGNTTFDANADSESATTNANGVASVNVTAEQNGTSTIDASSNLRSDSATLTIGSANFEVSDLAPQDATVNVSEAFDVSATVENTGSLQGEQEIELRLEPDGDAVLNQTVSLDPGANTTVTFENVTVDTAGEFNHTVASANDSATGSLTVEQREQEQEPPTATVTFENQTVQNGSTTVNVASATFNGSEAFNIVVHQASDDNDDGTIQASEIGKKIGESAELDNGTRTNITVNISKEVADNDNVSQLTENQTLVAMLHTTNTSDDNNIVHTAPITRDGTPVFDPANITVEEAAEDAPANFSVSGLEPQDATVNVSEAFDVSATVENTGDLQGEQEIELRLEPDGDAERNQTVSLNASENDTVIFENVTVDTAGEFNHTVASANDSATGSLTVEQREQEQEPPTATVTFENQTVQNGSTTVNVASATFNGSEAFNIVVHQATDDNEDRTIQASEIGKKIGESEALEPGSEPRTNVSVNISKQVADNDNVSQLTENETLVAMLHTTNTSDDDSIVHTAPITRDGTPVFDQADIGIEPESPLDGPAARFDENADGDISITELGQAGQEFAAGNLSITELGQVGQVFAR